MTDPSRDDLGELDRVLLSDEALVPSSGFAAAVMERVQEAAAEPPLAFPWLRAAIGAAACIVWAASGAALVATLDPSTLREVAASFEANASELGYAAAAIVASVGVLRLWRHRADAC